MSNDTVITVIGNLTADPELRFLPNGAAVANFTIASTPRSYDKAKGEWVDGDALFLRCSLWRDAAENLVESFGKGTRVIAQGRLKQRSFEKDGQKRSVIELEVDEIGPSVKYVKVQVTKRERDSFGSSRQSSVPDPWANVPASSPVSDPWGTSEEPVPF